jgi:hypothetical protein
MLVARPQSQVDRLRGEALGAGVSAPRLEAFFGQFA